MVQNVKIGRLELLLINLITFVFCLAMVSYEFGDLLYVIPLLSLEIAFLFLWLKSKDIHLQFLAWELQIFLLAFYFVAFRFNETFNIEKVSFSAYLAVVLVMIAIQIVFSIYLIFQERSIKSILFMISSSTAFCVLIILIFIINEGAPAFIENDPISFITGSSWQTNYYPESSKRLTLNAYLKDYGFNLTCDQRSTYIPSNSSSTVLIHIINEGGKADNILISASSSSTSVLVSLNRTLVAIEPYHVSTIELAIFTMEPSNVTLTLHAHSENGDQDRDTQVFVRVSDRGINFNPDSLSAQSYGEVINYAIPITIYNAGLIRNNFTLFVQSPSNFSSTLSGDGLIWDYSAMRGRISLGPGMSANLTLFPMMVSRVPGTYFLSVHAVSSLDPTVINTARVEYSYGLSSRLTSAHPNLPVTIGVPARFNVVLNSDQSGLHGLRLGGVSNDWNVTLIENGSLILSGNDFTNITIGNLTDENAGIRNFEIIATLINGEIPSNLTFYLDVIDWGSQPSYGILPFIFGTIATTGLAILIALPLGLGCSIFLSEYCPQRIRRVLRPMLELLAGIPSVVYGLWGFLVLGPFLAGSVYPVFGADASSSRSLLTASIVLSIMITPLIITLSEDSLRVVQREIKEASYGLGATKWQTIRRVSLPSAKSGITASVILATGRAIGETMAVLMIVGVVFDMPGSLFDGTGTMTSVIAATLPYSFDLPMTRHAVFAIALVLFMMVFVLNLIILRIQRDNKKQQRAGTSQANWIGKHSWPIRHINDFKNRISGQLGQKRKAVKATSNENGSTTISQPSKPVTLRKELSKTQVWKEKAVQMALVSSTVLIAGFLLIIIADIILKGGAAISLDFITQAEVGIGEQGGFANAIVGSLLLVGLAISFSVPLALGSALYVNEYSKKNNPAIKAILFSSNTLASTPSIVFGAFGFLFFVLFLGFKFSLIAGALTLTIMVLPLMLASSIEALKTVPNDYREASAALGASKWKSIRSVVLPTSFPMISTGIIISIGRAIGETAAILLTAGYSVLTVNSIFVPTASMPNLIFKNFEFSLKYPVLLEKVYSAAFILILIVLLLNFLAKLIGRRSPMK